MYGPDLAAHQEALEAEAYEIGAANFLRAMESKAEQGASADTQVARPLLADLVPKVSEAIQQWLATAKNGRAMANGAAAPLLRQINPDRAAFITVRAVLNALTSKPTGSAGSSGGTDDRANQTMVAISMTLGKDIEDEVRFGTIRDANKARFARSIAPAIAKRNREYFRKAYMRAVEGHMVEDGSAAPWDHWSNQSIAGVGLKLISLLKASTGFIEIVNINRGNRSAEKTVLEIAPEYTTWLAERTKALSDLVPQYAPCVVPPRPWTGCSGGGYWFNDSRRPLMLVRGGTARNKRYKEVDLTRVLKALNSIQNTPWRINEKVLKVAQAIASMPKPPIKKMPRKEPLGKLEQDPAINYDIDGVALKAWKKDAAAQYRKEESRKSRRYQLEFTLEQAQKYTKYERIWFPHSLDFRSRIYAATKFSPQGSDMDKGLLLLADAPAIGVDGAYWLKMHGANVAGLDKKDMATRIKWVDDNEGLILDIAANPLDNLWWATEADSPFCFLAFCFEYATWKAIGPTYECGLAIAFDGSCSGIQHFSAMLTDPVGGKAVNLVPQDEPSDIYRIVADKVNEQLRKDAQKGTADEVVEVTNKDTGEITQVTRKGTHTMAAWWLAFGVDRGVTKRSVMTLPYGSKKYGFTEQLLADIVNPAIDEKGPGVFPDPRGAASYMAGLIWDSLGETVVAAVKAMDWLQKVAAILTKEQMPCHWVTPVGFPVYQEYRQSDTHRIDTVIQGSIRVTMSVAKHASQEGPKPLDRHEQVNGIAPNFVHSMDASHMMLTVLEAGDRGVVHFACIHDSFGTAPGLAGVMFEAVRECMVVTYTSRDVIQDFFNTFESLVSEENRGTIPAFPPKGDLDLSLIRSSLYCFA